MGNLPRVRRSQRLSIHRKGVVSLESIGQARRQNTLLSYGFGISTKGENEPQTQTPQVSSVRVRAVQATQAELDERYPGSTEYAGAEGAHQRTRGSRPASRNPVKSTRRLRLVICAAVAAIVLAVDPGARAQTSSATPRSQLIDLGKAPQAGTWKPMCPQLVLPAQSGGEEQTSIKVVGQDGTIVGAAAMPTGGAMHLRRCGTAYPVGWEGLGALGR